MDSLDAGLFNQILYMSTLLIQDLRISSASLSMSTLLIQNMKVCNVFNAIYVNTVNTKHESV